LANAIETDRSLLNRGKPSPRRADSFPTTHGTRSEACEVEHDVYMEPSKIDLSHEDPSDDPYESAEPKISELF